ncbi:MAG: ABC transporter permease subunit [Phycisphaerae bacterium]|nr:ABC transporter permease subunit [Phycisphaerae bacterium]
MPIIDQGYQHWSGRLAGHRWRWLAITRHGVKIAMRSYFLRYVLLVAWVPALVLVTTLSAWGLLERKSKLARIFSQFMQFMNPGVIAYPRHYRAEVWRLAYGYFFHVELFFAMIVILIVGPGLISRDLRVNALPLYFSRPLRRIDYFLGKLGVVATFLGMVLIVPAVIAYIFGLLFSVDFTVLRDTFVILVGATAYGLFITVSAGLLILALSALSRNSRYVALLWLGLWFVGGIGSSVLTAVHQQQRHYAYHRAMALRVAPPHGPPWGGTPAAHEPAVPTSRNWRALLSYTANLSRVGAHLLGTNMAWERLSRLEPTARGRRRLLARFGGPWYPWYWSAVVLAALLGLSLCILNLSIRTLDRLK